MGFELLLEAGGLCFIAESSGDLDLPRSICLRALRLTPVAATVWSWVKAFRVGPLRVRDVDPSPLRYAEASVGRGTLTVRQGKGDKDYPRF